MAQMMDKIKQYGGLFKKTYQLWSEREPFNNAIIIAYYTIFSLPGLLVIVINLAGYFFDSGEVTSTVSEQVGGMMGGNTAKDVEAIVTASSKNEGTTLSSILAVATLLFGATGVFYQTQQILNKMWEVKPNPQKTKQKLLKLVKDRVFSFGLILVVGFLLLVSLVLSAGLTALSGWIAANVSDALIPVFKVLDIVVSVAIITLLFAAMYKCPEHGETWRTYHTEEIDDENDEVYEHRLCSVCHQDVTPILHDGVPILHPLTDEEAYWQHWEQITADEPDERDEPYYETPEEWLDEEDW